MINPNALPTSPTVQDFQNLESALDSSDYNDTLQAMQYMKRKPTGGLSRLPQVTVPMKKSGNIEKSLEEIKTEIREVKDNIPFYYLGGPLEKDKPGYLNDEIINKMNEFRISAGLDKTIGLIKGPEDIIDEIDKYAYRVREEPRKGEVITNLIDDVKARMKDSKYQNLLETLVRLRNPESAEEGKKQIDIENALAELYPDMIASEGKRVLPYIPGDVTQDRYGVRSVEGNLPSILVDRKEGGIIENPEEAMLMEQVEQQDPRQPNPEARAMAQQVASYGRGGDKLILHVRPDELQGLASMLTITINPETGMPEAFLKGLRRAVSSVTKPIRKVAKSKAFKTLAPIALSIAAPYAGAYLMGGSTVGLSAAVKAMSPTMFGGFTGLGSLAGNLLAGRSFGDSAKAGLISGFTAGVGRGISNKMAGKTFMGDSPTPTIDPEGYQAAGMDIVPTEGSPPVFEGQTAVPREAKMLTDYSQAVKPIEEPLKSTVSNVIESQTIEPRSLTGGLKEVGSAIAQDFNPMTKSGLINIAGKGLTGDIGASVVESQNMADKTDQQAEDELENMGYTITGYGATKVITDPSGVTLPSTLTPQQILLAKISGDSFQFVPKTTYVETKTGGLISMAEKGTGEGNIGDLPPRVEKTITQIQKDMMDDVYYMEDEQFEKKYNTSKNKAYQFIKDQTGMTDGDLNELFSGRALQPIDKKEQGGLIELAQGGEFSGMVPGQGGGMDDNVYMPIKEGPEQVGTLAVSPTEYVVDSYTMAALGDGNPEEGARVMDKTIKQIRKKAFGNTKQPNEIDGLAALKPMVQGV